jgi:hypothetical protein
MVQTILFAVVTILRARCLPLYPRLASISHYWPNQCLVDGSRSQSYLTTDGQSFSLSWCQGHHLGTVTNFLSFYLEIIFRHLRVCYYGTASLTRRRVCNLQLLLGLASTVFFGSEFRRTHDQILCSQIWDSLNLDGRSVSQSVYLGIGHPLWAHGQIFLY